MDDYNVCFIISHKYIRNYKSYIKYYVDNIQKYYSNSLCIIVDNNSKNIKDIIIQFKGYKNVVILTNVSLCKFELGAYKMGIYYLLEQNLLNKYEYVVFSQDNFVLKNKFDFNYMKNNDIFGLSFASADDGVHHHEHYMTEHALQILQKTNYIHELNKLSICWCHSFILHKSKVKEFLDMTKNFIINTRKLSESSERYFDAILRYFNNGNRFYMNNIKNMSYSEWNIDLLNDNIKECFGKSVQQKNENTVDI